MRSLLLPSSQRFLESLAFTQTLFAFDFDGTLTKIVERPSDAILSKKTATLLQQLSSVAQVAVISGRGLNDLKARLGKIAAPIHLIGNHGLEGLQPPQAALSIAERVCKKWNRQLNESFSRQKQFTGIELEDKTYSIAIHFRRSRHKKSARLMILEATTALTPSPRIIMGKAVINILPPGAPHKGVALIELMNRLELRSAFFIGDDDTDEDVFALPDSRIMSVRVGIKRSSRAQYFINRQSEINKIIKMILQFHATSR